MPEPRTCLHIGHKGAAGLEPENTLRSLRRALELGVDMVEFDVRRTRDGAIVLLHAEELAETTNGQGRVGDWTLSDLRQLDAGRGERIPTLEEAIETVRGRARMLVDLKETGWEDALVRVLRAMRVEHQAMVSSLIASSLQRLKARNPTLKASFSYPEDKGGASQKPYLAPIISAVVWAMRFTLPWRILGMLDSAQADAATLYYKLVTPRIVELIHRRGREVYVWTVDDPAEMRRFRAMGVDGVISNRPDLLVDSFLIACCS
jgi:glycerophosphoryl diester phosphodiesterase